MKRYSFFIGVITGLTLLVIAIAIPSFWKVHQVSGVVYDESGRPVSEAVVRLRATSFSAKTDAEGRFVLEGFPAAFKIRVTAWAEGYYVTGQSVRPWNGNISLSLSPYTVPDNMKYEWIPPVIEGRTNEASADIKARLDHAATLDPDSLFFKVTHGLVLGCQDCHENVYDQWTQSAHALGFTNTRFASMYNGTDISGEFKSPLTRYAYSRDYGRFPLRPDLSQPYYGPGYKLDFPETNGNCATCHLPAAALAAPYGTDPNEVAGTNALGSHCDFCHKIYDVLLDPSTGSPYKNMPGILSFEMMRPSEDNQIFFGPYDDVDAGSDTYLPLQDQSQYCAPCHSASFWDVPIYQSFDEWLASPYSDPERAKQAGLDDMQSCQDCHMKPDGVTSNFAPNRAGLEREPAEVFTHVFPGAADEALLQNAVTMTVHADRDGDRILVSVTITNDKTGHDVPTDSPLRQMILLVHVTGANGESLDLLSGPTVPDWGGIGDPDEGYYAGLPGTGFAKILKELWTDVSPTGAYWNPTIIVSDNRLAALESDTSTYVFDVSGITSTEISIHVQLLFRRAFKDLIDQKNWPMDDIIMEDEWIIISD